MVLRGRELDTGAIEDLDSAIFYANKVLELNKLARYSISQLDALSLLVYIYKSTQNMDSVAKYLELTVNTKDSLFSRQKIMQLQSMTFNEQLRQQQGLIESLNRKVNNIEEANAQRSRELAHAQNEIKEAPPESRSSGAFGLGKLNISELEKAYKGE